MQNTIKYLLILFVFLFLSCNKDTQKEAEESITKFGVDSNGMPNVGLMRRLAFGKCVAIALKNVSFRNYIARNSHVDEENYFLEIIFDQHKDSLVDANRSMR